MAEAEIEILIPLQITVQFTPWKEEPRTWDEPGTPAYIEIDGWEIELPPGKTLTQHLSDLIDNEIENETDSLWDAIPEPEPDPDELKRRKERSRL